MQQASTYRRIIGLAVAAFATAALAIASTPTAASASTTAPPAGLTVTGEDISVDHSTVTDTLGGDVDKMASDVIPSGATLGQDQIAQLLAQLTGNLGNLGVGQGLNLPLGLGA